MHKIDYVVSESVEKDEGLDRIYHPAIDLIYFLREDSKDGLTYTFLMKPTIIIEKKNRVDSFNCTPSILHLFLNSNITLTVIMDYINLFKSLLNAVIYDMTISPGQHVI